MSTHRVILGDSRLLELDDHSIDFVVTSPPYWSIKDYGMEGQIGMGQSYSDYLDDMGQVIYECHRVLRPGCRMALNIGDQYLRAADHGRYHVQPIPADLSVLARRVGFDFMGQIIWRKISTTKTSGGGQWMGSIYYPKDGHLTYEHEYILLLKKPGKWNRPVPGEREKSRLTKEERKTWFRGVWDDLPPARQNGHVAQFPIELPRRLIKMYSFWGEIVLDPFLGSGTTLLAADMLGRQGVGIELNPEFLPIMKTRFEEAEVGEVSYETSEFAIVGAARSVGADDHVER